jgi:hypothetical protein
LLRRATPTDASEIRTMAIQARRSIMSARMTAPTSVATTGSTDTRTPYLRAGIERSARNSNSSGIAAENRATPATARRVAGFAMTSLEA